MDEQPKKQRKPRAANRNPFPVSQEQKDRLRPHQFVPGQSGNPAGSTRTSREYKELVAGEVEGAFHRIVEMSKTARQESVRLKANTYIVNKVVSDAAQLHDVDIQVSSFSDFLAVTNQRSTSKSDVIDAKPADVVEVRHVD